MKKNNHAVLFICSFCFLLIGIFFGFIFGHKTDSISLTPLRDNTNNYKYISPLLACDTEIELTSSNMLTLTDKIENLINDAKNKRYISSASVYLRDYIGGYVVSINSDEKYYPASLNKIPVMIAAYKMSSVDQAFLDKKFVYDDNDYNDVAVKPSDFLASNHAYTINEAIDKMIRTSDNNALVFLSKHISQDVYNETFSELNLNVPSASSLEDTITAKDFSYMLRVLYNATYLSRQDSEKALNLLASSEYSNGIVAGLPESTTVAHKFGLLTIQNNDVFQKRQLHDAGIVYPKDRKPYLVSIMTKSDSSDLSKNEQIIQEISKVIYDSMMGM